LYSTEREEEEAIYDRCPRPQHQRKVPQLRGVLLFAATGT